MQRSATPKSTGRAPGLDKFRSSEKSSEGRVGLVSLVSAPPEALHRHTHAWAGRRRSSQADEWAPPDPSGGGCRLRPRGDEILWRCLVRRLRTPAGSRPRNRRCLPVRGDPTAPNCRDHRAWGGEARKQFPPRNRQFHLAFGWAHLSAMPNCSRPYFQRRLHLRPPLRFRHLLALRILRWAFFVPPSMDGPRFVIQILVVAPALERQCACSPRSHWAAVRLVPAWLSPATISIVRISNTRVSWSLAVAAADLTKMSFGFRW